MGKRIEAGDRAPDFTAKTQAGEDLTLSDYRGRSTVVLYFYPKDDTPGCTLEARCFRDHYHDFVAAGAVVIGVSSDSIERHQGFAQRNELPFQLVSDPDGSIRSAYGVPRSFGLLPGRVTYVIDKEGVVRDLFNSQLRSRRHVDRALEMVNSLQKQ